MINIGLFLKFKIACLATRSTRSGQFKLCNNFFIQAPSHTYTKTNIHTSQRQCMHTFTHTCTYKHWSYSLCQVQSSITTTRSGGQTLNFKKSPIIFSGSVVHGLAIEVFLNAFAKDLAKHLPKTVCDGILNKDIRGFSKQGVPQILCGTGTCEYCLLGLHTCISACMSHG